MKLRKLENIGHIRKTEGRLDSAQRDRRLVTQDMGKLEAFSASGFARRLAFRNPRFQRPLEKVRAKKVCPWWKRIRPGNT